MSEALLLGCDSLQQGRHSARGRRYRFIRSSRPWGWPVPQAAPQTEKMNWQRPPGQGTAGSTAQAVSACRRCSLPCPRSAKMQRSPPIKLIFGTLLLHHPRNASFTPLHAIYPTGARSLPKYVHPWVVRDLPDPRPGEPPHLLCQSPSAAPAPLPCLPGRLCNEDAN